MVASDSEPPLPAPAAVVLPCDEPSDPPSPPGATAAQPLRGRRVLVMRPAHQIPPTAALLQAHGAETMALPSIAIVPPPDPAAVARAIAELARYHVVIFTSENAVEALWQAMAEPRNARNPFGKARIAAIGRATTDALRGHGVIADIVPERFVAEELAAAILAHLGDAASQAHVLLPRAREAREILPETLRAAGVRVDVVPVYQTIPAPTDRAEELKHLLREGRIDYVLLCSSSTVTSLCTMLGRDALTLLGCTRLASIGPVTTQRAHQLGLEVAVTAPVSTTESLVAAVAAHACRHRD
jgi:uroporphyrinogen III methyltransferase/synthase